MTSENKIKKTWETPKITLLATDKIRGGANPSFHENTMTGLHTIYKNGKIGHVNHGPRASSSLAYNAANVS